MKLGWFFCFPISILIASCTSTTIKEAVEEVSEEYLEATTAVLVSQYDSFSTQFLKSYSIKSEKVKQFDCVLFAKSDAINHLGQEVLYFFYESGDEIEFSSATNVNEAYNIALASKPFCSCKYVNGVYVQ